MKSTMEILTKLQENSQKNHDEIFTRLYRYLLRPDIYFIAYQHLYSNKGAGTKGVNDDTADGFSEQYVTAIIEALRTGSYEPKPVRRTYIQKKNGKLRPLGLDKQYPQYQLAKHKGYPTKLHYELIAQYGIQPFYRRSFLKKQGYWPENGK